MKVPVLFVVFNRLDVSQKVFASIQRYKPLRFYIACDGPRVNSASDINQIKNVREFIINSIDWDCEVFTLFQDMNLGCRDAVSSAITWFFENEEAGIILEDDSLPHDSFFPFCEYLLERYRHNLKVFSIGGANFSFGRSDSMVESYYYSKFFHCWGWASWRDRWKKYDKCMKEWKIHKDRAFFDDYKFSEAEKLYWTKIFDAISNNAIDTWDYQFNYAFWKNRAVSVIPKVNLVSNIGFGAQATHTKSHSNPLEKISRKEIFFPLYFPDKIHPNIDIDSFVFNSFYSPSFLKRVLRKFGIKDWRDNA